MRTKMESGNNESEQQRLESAKKLLGTFGQCSHRPDGRPVMASEGNVWLSNIDPEILPPTTEVGREVQVSKPYANGCTLKITISTFNEEVIPLLNARHEYGDYPLGTCSINLEAPEGYTAEGGDGHMPQFFGMSWWISENLTADCNWETTPFSADIAGIFEELLNDELGIPFVAANAELSSEWQDEVINPMSVQQIRLMQRFIEEHLTQ